MSKQIESIDGTMPPDLAAGRSKTWRIAFAGVSVAGLAMIAAGAWWFGSSVVPQAHSSAPLIKPVAKKGEGKLVPTTDQWAALTVEDVTPNNFRNTITTDGRIAIDEDHTTPVFSPYAGRVIALHAKAGDHIEVGQPLFTIAATDMVQAQNDVVSAVASLNKASSALRLAEINLTRAKNLFEQKAGSQRDFQAAEDTRNAAQADKAAADAALAAARNRLRLFGKSDAEIALFEREGKITPETVIPSPLSGTVVQRKMGPGQFVAGAQSDPVFVIGDLSHVWVIANVKETDAPVIQLGAPIEFRLLALPSRNFTGTVNYIASIVDPASRRLTVRAEVSNTEGLLKPEMFATVEIVTSDQRDAPSVPRAALVYEGDVPHVWTVGHDRSVSKRAVKVGAVATGRVQVVDGLTTGERIVSKGSLFIDRLSGAAE